MMACSISANFATMDREDDIAGSFRWLPLERRNTGRASLDIHPRAPSFGAEITL